MLRGFMAADNHHHAAAASSDGTFAVNTAFFPIAGCTLPHAFAASLCPSSCLQPCTVKQRLAVQMELYKREAIFGILENKLLMKLVLRALGIPHTAFYYGALLPPDGVGMNKASARPVHPDVPWYDSARLQAAVANVSDHRFVLKPLTEGGTMAVVVMDGTKWDRLKERRGGSGTDVAAHLVKQLEKKSLSRQRSSWNQLYEHRGVLLEERYAAPASSLVVTATNAPPTDGAYELKVFVVFGVPTSIALFPPAAKGALGDPHDGCVELLREEQEQQQPDPSGPGRRRPPSLLFHCLPYNGNVKWMPAFCKSASAWINEERNLASIDAWSQTLARTIGADWLRLDLFAGDVARGFVVNEVTYPSHHGFPDEVWTRYAKRYANRSSWSTVPAQQILERVSALAQLPLALVQTRSRAVMMRKHGGEGGMGAEQ